MTFIVFRLIASVVFPLHTPKYGKTILIYKFDGKCQHITSVFDTMQKVFDDKSCDFHLNLTVFVSKLTAKRKLKCKSFSFSNNHHDSFSN